MTHTPESVEPAEGRYCGPSDNTTRPPGAVTVVDCDHCDGAGYIRLTKQEIDACPVCTARAERAWKQSPISAIFTPRVLVTFQDKVA